LAMMVTNGLAERWVGLGNQLYCVTWNFLIPPDHIHNIMKFKPLICVISFSNVMAQFRHCSY